MPRGRTPRPTKLKILQGEPNKDRINENEPEAPKGRPPMPRGLDAIGKKAWVEICESLEALEILSVVDGPALEFYAHTYSDYRIAKQHIKKHGHVITENGYMKRNPACAEMHQNKGELLRLLTEFGLTPASRSRLVVPGAKKAFEVLDELLA